MKIPYFYFTINLSYPVKTEGLDVGGIIFLNNIFFCIAWLEFEIYFNKPNKEWLKPKLIKLIEKGKWSHVIFRFLNFQFGVQKDS